MVIPIKSGQEIESMRRAGRILAGVMVQLLAAAKPGVKTKELDTLAEKLIKKADAKPSFKMVDNYQWASCINLNDGLVHGIPNDYQIKAGDLVTLDLGVFYQGFHADMARTLRVQAQSSREKERFLEIGQEVLRKATAMARPGNRVGHISQIIQQIVEKAGYSVSRKFTGHGIGRSLHEEPKIPCFLEGSINKTPKLKANMTLAIEVIYSQGRPEVKVAQDGWTASTADAKLGGLFEDTVLITETRPKVLTVVK